MEFQRINYVNDTDCSGCYKNLYDFTDEELLLRICEYADDCEFDCVCPLSQLTEEEVYERLIEFENTGRRRVKP